jgi:hypothetical protein
MTTMKYVRDALATASLSLLAACSSRAVPAPSGIDDAAIPLADAAAADGAAAAEVAVVDTTRDVGESGPPALGPVTPAPPAMGDGRLADVPDENPGGTPDGWDFCQSDLVAGPRAGKSDPPASRGARYWLYSPATPQPSPDPARPLAQAYFYFGQPLASGGKGLYFDATLVSGTAAGATLELYSVDEVCQKPVSLGGYSLSALLVMPGKWATTCITLPSGLLLNGLGVRLEAAKAELGVDAFRFGPPCPALP